MSAGATCSVDSDTSRFYLPELHEVGSGLWHDWTLSDNWEVEYELREIRNQMIEKRLRSGKSAAWRQSGNSLWPDIKSGELCGFDPLLCGEFGIREGDIVFCKVRPSGQYYAHKVLARYIDPSTEEFRWKIGNNSGHTNGWCGIEDIYGRFVAKEDELRDPRNLPSLG